MEESIIDLDYFRELLSDSGDGSLVLYVFCREIFLFQEHIRKRLSVIQTADEDMVSAINLLENCAALISDRLEMDYDTFVKQSPESMLNFYRSHWSRFDWSWKMILASLRNGLIRLIVVSLRGYISIFADLLPPSWVAEINDDIQLAYELFMLIDERGDWV